MKVIPARQSVDAGNRGYLREVRFLPFPAAVVSLTLNRQSVARMSEIACLDD
jgi:hypothetical protein